MLSDKASSGNKSLCTLLENTLRRQQNILLLHIVDPVAFYVHKKFNVGKQIL